MERVPVKLDGKEVGWAEVTEDGVALIEIAVEDAKDFLGYGKPLTNISIAE